MVRWCRTWSVLSTVLNFHFTLCLEFKCKLWLTYGGTRLNDAEVFPKIFKMEGVSVVEGGKTKIILWNLGILALKLGEALKLIIGGGA